MRTFFAIIIGCVAMLVAFSLPWSYFAVGQDAYSGEGLSSQFLFVAIYFGIYLLPFSLIFALLLVFSAERFGRRFTRLTYHILRGGAWLLTAGVYIGSTSVARPDLSVTPAACGLFAAIIASLIYSLVVRPYEIKSHTTAA